MTSHSITHGNGGPVDVTVRGLYKRPSLKPFPGCALQVMGWECFDETSKISWEARKKDSRRDRRWKKTTKQNSALSFHPFVILEMDGYLGKRREEEKREKEAIEWNDEKGGKNWKQYLDGWFHASHLSCRKQFGYVAERGNVRMEVGRERGNKWMMNIHFFLIEVQVTKAFNEGPSIQLRSGPTLRQTDISVSSLSGQWCIMGDMFILTLRIRGSRQKLTLCGLSWHSFSMYINYSLSLHWLIH